MHNTSQDLTYHKISYHDIILVSLLVPFLPLLPARQQLGVRPVSVQGVHQLPRASLQIQVQHELGTQATSGGGGERASEGRVKNY